METTTSEKKVNGEGMIAKLGSKQENIAADRKSKEDSVHPAEVVEPKQVANSSKVVESVTSKFLIDVNKVSVEVEGSNGVEVNIGGDGAVIVVSGSDKYVDDGMISDGVISRGDNKRGNSNGNYQEQVDIEKSKDTDHVYQVGDLVWGKIKRHPWWPGQIYDTKDASDFALKHGQEDRILVAFFGDGSCSWCLPSYLVPFVENFNEMSKDSTSKSFLNAVHLAADEVRRVLETDMTCNCIPVEKRDGISRPVVQNAGVKPGVLVPEVDVGQLSIPKYEPDEVLTRLVHFAKSASIGSALEAGVLRGWLSAFYCSKGIVHLPVYVEPITIEGLEDISSEKGENELVTEDFSVPIEVPLLGPQDDDWLSLPATANAGTSNASGDLVYHRRKHKSVAEIMADSVCVSPKRKNRNFLYKEPDVEKSKSLGKRKKIEDGDTEGGSKRLSQGGKPSGKMKAKGETGSKVAESGDMGKSTKKPKKIEVGTSEETSGEAIEESEIVSTPRERKKSKFLTPPFAESIWRVGSSSFKKQSESAEKAKIKLCGGQTKKKASDHAPEPVDSAYAGKWSGDDELKESGAPIVTAPEIVYDEGNRFSFPMSDIDVPVSEILTGMQRATVDPLYLSKNGSLDTVWGFISALRSSTYRHGSDYTTFRKSTMYKKGKSLTSEPEKPDSGHDKKALKGKRKSVSSSKISKTEKSEEKSETSKTKDGAEISQATYDAGKPKANTFSSALIITFTPGSPLPSKEDVVNVYGKFGKLKSKETNVLADSHSAQIVYRKYSNAEAAFKSSVSENPFGVDNVQNYWLRHSLAPSKSPPEATQPKKRTVKQHHAPDNGRGDAVSEIKVIMRNLEIMGATVENYRSKFTDDEKACVREELKSLMEKVETAGERVRVMAENTSF